jgi:hypothetical protein
VCWDAEKATVDGHRFRGDKYDLPEERGFSAQIYTIMPALYGFSVTGAKTHFCSPKFMFVINLN